MKQVILWDWNGTIVDDVRIALDAVNEMLRKKGRSGISLDEYRRAMATPILRFYERFFDMDTTDFTWITEQFQEYYRVHISQLRLHEGIPALLQQGARMGCRQIVVSSSASEIIVRDARRFHVSSYFAQILGAQDLFAASKVERALSYFREAGIQREEAVLIGDTVHDYEVAEALAIDCILLSDGHQDRKSLEDCGCPVYASAAALAEAVEGNRGIPRRFAAAGVIHDDIM